MDYYKKLYMEAAIAILVGTALTLLFPYQIPISTTPNVTTLINGITTMTGIIVALGGVMFGQFIFHNEFKNDPKARSEYYERLGFFILPPMYIFTAYWLVAWGLNDYAVRMSLCGFFMSLLVFLAFYLQNLKRLNSNVEKKKESDKPSLEDGQTPSQTGKKRRKWFSIKSLTLVALLISTSSNVYFAVQNQNMQTQNQNIQNSLYALQNSLYNYPPFIYSNNTIFSAMNTVIANPNDTIAVLFGNVNVDLKVITPYDGMLTITAKVLNFTHINETNWFGLQFVDLNDLNYSEHSVFDLAGEPHQYFILHDVINSIEVKIPIEITVILKPNWLPSNSAGIGFDLGVITFEANLFAVRINQTTTTTFIENVTGMFTPTS